MIVKQMVPLFEEGRILKKEALERIRDFMPEYLSVIYGSYGEGLLAGFDITGGEDGITVSPGLLKDNGSYFLMGSPASLPCAASGKPVKIMLRRRKPEKTPDVHTLCYELEAEAAEAESTGLELGRFCLEPGARLRTKADYKDLHDLATEFNTVCILRTRFAWEGGGGLHPLVFRMYARGIFASGRAQPEDLAFAAACLGSAFVPGELVARYLERKGIRAEEDNLRLYGRLVQLYDGFMGPGGREKPSGGGSRKTWIG